jgi:hypothetical protein
MQFCFLLCQFENETNRCEATCFFVGSSRVGMLRTDSTLVLTCKKQDGNQPTKYNAGEDF